MGTASTSRLTRLARGIAVFLGFCGVFYVAFGLVFYETPLLPVFGVILTLPYLISRWRRKKE